MERNHFLFLQDSTSLKLEKMYQEDSTSRKESKSSMRFPWLPSASQQQQKDKLKNLPQYFNCECLCLFLSYVSLTFFHLFFSYFFFVSSLILFFLAISHLSVSLLSRLSDSSQKSRLTTLKEAKIAEQEENMEHYFAPVMSSVNQHQRFQVLFAALCGIVAF